MFRIRARKQRANFLLDVTVDVNASRIAPGVVALFGRSGCGKTTLVSIIAGLLDADDAQIEIDGVLLEDTRLRVRTRPEQRQIGYVFQDARLFPHFDVLGNLRYGAQRARNRDTRITFEHVLQLLGLQPLLQRRIHQLSGGERQRVALGRALLSQPRLLLRDEPLASLDASRREEVLPYLERLRDELALPMIFVSHQFDEVLRLATHVVLLEQGRVVTQGGVDVVSLHPELRAIVGPDAIGAVLLGTVEQVSMQDGLAAVRVGNDVLHLQLRNAQPGASVRVQLLARDVILATAPPQNLSVRNILAGSVARMTDDHDDTHLIHVDIGGAVVLARITRAASNALALRVGLPVWVLAKAVSIRDHAFIRDTSGMAQ